MTQSFYPYLLTSMTETTNSQPKKSNAGTSIPSKDSHVLPDAEAERRRVFYRKMAYIEMKKLRPKHPHV